MNDSNQTGPKSYLQRFKEIETTMFECANAVNGLIELASAQSIRINELSRLLEKNEEHARLQTQTTAAVIDLLSSGNSTVTMDLVSKRIEEMSVEVVKKNIEAIKSASSLEDSDIVASDSDIIVYSVPNFLTYGYQPLVDFNPNVIEALKKAKVGDTVSVEGFSDSIEIKRILTAPAVEIKEENKVSE